MAGVTVTDQVTGQKSGHITLLDTGRARRWPNLKSGLRWVFAIASPVAASTASLADILMGKVVDGNLKRVWLDGTERLRR